MIVSNPLGYDENSSLSPIQQYPSPVIYYLDKLLLILPFIILSIFILLYVSRKRIRISKSGIEVRGMFRIKHFNMKEITRIKQVSNSRGSIACKVYASTKLAFRMQDSLKNYERIIARLQSEHVEMKEE